MTTVNGTTASSPSPPTIAQDTSRIITLQSLVSHVMDVFDLSDNEVDVRRAKRSALWGYEQALTRHTWNIYDEEATVYLNGEDKDGSVSINSAGEVTRTSPAWPSWADKASFYISDDRAYRVKTRDSDTQITLEDWNGQTESPTDFSLRHDRVFLPADVRKVYDVWHQGDDTCLQPVDTKTFREYDRPRIYKGSDPRIVCFRTAIVGGKHSTEMRVSPAATTAVELDVAYMRHSRMPFILEFCSDVNTAGNTVTLTTPVPVGVNLVGCLVRVAADRAISPESEDGFGVYSEVPVAFEGFISEQTSTTQFTVVGVPAMSDGKLVITDTLDVPPRLMLAVKSYAEAQMSRIGRGDIREYRTLMVEADEQLRYAMEQDAPYEQRSSFGSVQVDHLEKTIYVSES